VRSFDSAATRRWQVDKFDVIVIGIGKGGEAAAGRLLDAVGGSRWSNAS
jgi:hypothetical protein